MIKEKRMIEAQMLRKQGFKQKEIAERLNVSDRTVRSYLSKPACKRKKVLRLSKLDTFMAFIKSLISEKPWYNCMVLFERLKTIGYTGKISILRDHIAQVRRKVLLEAVIRFETEPGLQAQVDWKEFGKQMVNGVWQKLYAFVMVLGFSRKAYVCFTTSMTANILLWCHIRAFEYFNGVPKEILYDNMKTAFICNSEGEFYPNRRLLAFANHYGFTPKRCMIYRPQTKGKVERFIDYVENNFWLGYEAEDYHIDMLDEAAVDWLGRIDNIGLRDFNESRADRFLREKDVLTRMPVNPFDCRDENICIVNRESLINIDTNRYSVPPRYIGEQLAVLIDVRRQNAELCCPDGFKRFFSLYTKGIKEKMMFPEDKKAIYEMWQKQREKRLNRIRKRKKICTRTNTEVDTRPPSFYEQYSWEVA